MTTVFIGGSRFITTIAPVILPRLDAIIARGHAVVIGDADGVDRCVQTYFAERQYQNVTVFSSGAQCRANIGAWPHRVIATTARPGTRAFYTAKDLAMAHDATCGLMLWDMRSGGTFANIATLVQAGKPLLLYLAPSNDVLTVRTIDDLAGIIARCPASARARFYQRLHQEHLELT